MGLYPLCLVFLSDSLCKFLTSMVFVMRLFHFLQPSTKFFFVVINKTYVILYGNNSSPKIQFEIPSFLHHYSSVSRLQSRFLYRVQYRDLFYLGPCFLLDCLFVPSTLIENRYTHKTNLSLSSLVNT